MCVEGVEDALRRVVLADDVVASSCEAVGEPAVFADALPCLARLRQRGVAAEQDSTRGVLGGGGSCFGRLVLLLRRLGLKLRFGLRLRLRLRRRGDDAGARGSFLELREDGESVLLFFKRFFQQAFQRLRLRGEFLARRGFVARRD